MLKQVGIENTGVSDSQKKRIYVNKSAQPHIIQKTAMFRKRSTRVDFPDIVQSCILDAVDKDKTGNNEAGPIDRNAPESTSRSEFEFESSMAANSCRPETPARARAESLAARASDPPLALPRGARGAGSSGADMLSPPPLLSMGSAPASAYLHTSVSGAFPSMSNMNAIEEGLTARG